MGKVIGKLRRGMNMDARRREVFLVSLCGLLVISALGALVLLDRSHGSFGKEIDPAQVDASITNVQGSIGVEQVPSDIYMFGAGLSASLSVQITNMDPDNDIDSIRFTIPDSLVQTSSFEWYIPGTDHDWEMTSDQPGIAIFTAQNDLPGRIFGGSAQYDVAGNIDDALDHNPLNNTNEEATFTLGFTVPSQPGFKTGTNAINVEVADLQTESPGSAWQGIDPFPKPYLVVENGNRFVVMVLKTSTCDMSVVHDGTSYFAPTRASDIGTSSVGFKLNNEQGHTVILVSDPGTGRTVKPMVYAKSSGLQGDFTLSMFRFEVVNKVTGEVSIETIATDYLEDIPADTSSTVDTDMDNDGTLNNLDTDMDGDGIANNIDPDPRDPLVNNVAPINVVASVDIKVVKEGEKFVLTGEATDANNDILTFTWTHDKDAAWKKTGKSITVDDLGPGTYIFTLNVSDGKLSATDEVTVKLEEKGSEPIPITLIIAGIIFAVIIVVVIIIFARRGSADEGKGDQVSDAPEPAAIPEIAGNDEEETVDRTVGSEEAPASTPDGTIEKAGPTTATISDVEMLGDPCPECGNPIGPEEIKCPSCGAEFDMDLYCPNCDSKIDESDQACKNCGIKFDLEERPN